MGVIGALIVANIRGLATFSGRNTRQQFWPYAGFIFALSYVGMMAIMMPVMLRMQRFALAHPDQAQIQAGPGNYSVSIHGSHPSLLAGMASSVAIWSLVLVILLAAAVARRLHDTGRTGFWGLLPLPFLALGIFGMSRIFDNPADTGTFALIFFDNLFYLAALVSLILMLARRGTPGPNRFGADPLAPA